MANNVANKSSKDKYGTLARSYLLVYNVVQSLGWSYILYQATHHFLFDANPHKESLYDKVWLKLVIFQNLMALDTVHVFVGLVPSNVQVTLQQIASRVIVICGVLLLMKTPRESIGFVLLLFAWCCAEIIRYSNYAFNLFTKVPYFLFYLRYTAFYILYPIGVSGELLSMYSAYKESKLLAFLSPQVNLFVYYPYIIVGVMLLYIPLFPQMYYHMIKQRRKQLGTPMTKKVE